MNRIFYLEVECYHNNKWNHVVVVWEADNGQNWKDFEDFVSESWEDLKETVGEYLEDSAVTVIGNWREVDPGYEVAEMLAVFLPMIIYTIENRHNELDWAGFGFPKGMPNDLFLGTWYDIDK